MCGFLAAASTKKINPEFHQELLEASQKISHRGPDRTSYCLTERTTSIFHRLIIRDLSTRSDQPIKSKCGRYIVCFNGELYGTEGREFLNFSEFESDRVFTRATDGVPTRS